MPKNGNGRNKNTNAETRDGLHGRIAALSQASGIDEACPDPEELAAFAEGRLRGSSRKKIMGHLNDCVLCRRHWQMVQTTLEEMDVREATWTEKIADKLKNIKERWIFLGGGVGLAVATGLLVILLMPRQDELSGMIGQSYGYLSPAGVARYNSFAARGVEETPPAYQAGVTDGQDRLRTKNSAPEKEQDFANNLDLLLYSMGQWSVVLQCSCVSHEPGSKEFWAVQKAIAVEVQHELNNSAKAQFEIGPIMESVVVIQNAVQQILETGNSVNGCEEITFAFQNIENHLRSRTTPTYR